MAAKSQNPATVRSRIHAACLIDYDKINFESTTVTSIMISIVNCLIVVMCKYLLITVIVGAILIVT